MNRLMTEYYPTFAHYQSLRDQMLELLTDADLNYQPSAANATLGTLCREIGETQYGYIESFKAWQHDFSYHNPEPMLTQHIATLKEWYAKLDSDLHAVIEALSDDDLTKTIDRGGWSLPVTAQLDVYKEALLIFYGKADVYLKMLGKPLTEQWREWIA
ncbi:MAG: DinB family protein [Ktedonobacterales bacterium]|nr:DinB family protein [Ktedonobacterales bacterium]